MVRDTLNHMILEIKSLPDGAGSRPGFIFKGASVASLPRGGRSLFWRQLSKAEAASSFAWSHVALGKLALQPQRMCPQWAEVRVSVCGPRKGSGAL